ncbi:hypothetical protein SEUCBS139899_004353 [Sporothrix eucalyptigena]|uniref:EthD domain-containing protein n=1 Tax=Sporothrix eucalyptigena TaxID=1812306 RepID=A0ABP0CS54_9PEZI
MPTELVTPSTASFAPTDPPPVDHPFHHAHKLAYDRPSNRQRYWRINMYFNKKPGVSDAYFVNHWHHVHADLVTGMRAFNEKNLLRYNQFFQAAEARTAAEAMGYGPLLDWDACTEFWVESIEDFVAFTKSQEYIDATPDIHNFVNVETGIRIMAGYDNLVFGEAVTGFGEDGVLKKEL